MHVQDPIYRPFLTLLAKLLFLSSAIHQLVFALCSTLPFAVGQVQDVGLIFLSAMASSVAEICTRAGRSPEMALSTSLLTLTCSTCLVGIVIIAVGELIRPLLAFCQPQSLTGGVPGLQLTD